MDIFQDSIMIGGIFYQTVPKFITQNAATGTPGWFESVPKNQGNRIFVRMTSVYYPGNEGNLLLIIRE